MVTELPPDTAKYVRVVFLLLSLGLNKLLTYHYNKG